MDDILFDFPEEGIGKGRKHGEPIVVEDTSLEDSDFSLSRLVDRFTRNTTNTHKGRVPISLGYHRIANGRLAPTKDCAISSRLEPNRSHSSATGRNGGTVRAGSSPGASRLRLSGRRATTHIKRQIQMSSMGLKEIEGEGEGGRTVTIINLTW